MCVYVGLLVRVHTRGLLLSQHYAYSCITLCIQLYNIMHIAVCYVPLGSPSRPTTICVSSVCDDTTASCTLTESAVFPSCSPD
jgi:hypothetical protein